jgi:uncharacterized repeat protein (TIGR01451 family)/uncharacterized delta-60 repeat protein
MVLTLRCFMERLRKNVPLVIWRGLAPLGILVLLGWSCSTSWAQPANDNFANAQVISGPSGSVTGNNINATLEPGEPATVLGSPCGASVWYSWTAPSSGLVTFNTFGSTSVVNTGDLDTVLGIYTGASVANLTFVAGNDDANSSTLTSSVTFQAAAGTTYMIAVDGFDYQPPDTGNIVLNWNAGQTAGDFAFTSQLYIDASDENFGVISPFMHVHPAGAHATVTRIGGTAGRVLVDVNFTNTFYTNLLFVEAFGTNIFSTNIANNVTNYNNSYLTNFLFTEIDQDFEFGEFVNLIPRFYATFTNVIDANGTVTITGGTLDTNTIVVLCTNVMTVTNIVSTNPPSTDIEVTNVFCKTSFSTFIVNSAEPGIDYIPGTTTLTFDDFQMSADASLPIIPGFHFAIPVLNHLLIATVGNAQLDALESTNLGPPTTSSFLTNTFVNLMDRNLPLGTNDNLVGHNMQVGTNVINFARACTLACTESVNGFGVARVWVTRSGAGIGNTSASVQYRIDHHPIDGDNANNQFRRGGANHRNYEIPLNPGSDYATPSNSFVFSPSPVDYTPVSGTLNFPPTVNVMPIDIPISLNPDVEFNGDMLLQLYYDTEPDKNQMSIGYINNSTLTILFNDQPAGAVDRTHNMDNDPTTDPPYDLHPGANGSVFVVTVQPDGKTLLGGSFSGYNTVPRYGVARANLDGSIDAGFNPAPAAGADQFVSALALDGNGNIVIGGAFNSFNGIPSKGIARLNSDGSLDGSFNPGLGATHADGTVATVWAVVPQPDGILAAGEFTSINGTNRNYIARLLTNGVVDAAFDPGVGPNGPVLSMVVQSDGRLLIGGEFTAVSGTPRNRIARLNSDGSLDLTFDPANGADDIVYTLALQNDGKVLLGGAFKNVRNSPRSSLARLDPDGSLDLGFDPGAGANDTIYSITLQPDQNILIGGIFTSYNQTRRVGFARLYTDASLDTTFLDTAYNQYAGLPNHYFNPDVESHNFVFSSAVQLDGNVVIGGGFQRVGGGFPPAGREDIRNRANFARLIGGSTPGPGNIELDRDAYTANENGGLYFVRMLRNNGLLGPAQVTVTPNTLPPGPGAAVNNVDFTFNNAVYGTPTWITTWSRPTWQLSDGTYGQNNGMGPTVEPGLTVDYLQNDVYINIIEDNILDGNRQFNLALNNPNGNDIFFLGGQNIPLGVALGRANASLTIVNDATLAGTLTFSSPTYSVSEGGGLATITVVRTNGSTGLVTVKYSTSDGTAVAPTDYKARSGTLSFPAGVTNSTFTIPIINDSLSDDDKTVNLSLFNSTGGANLGISNAVLTIIDDNSPNGRLNFSAAAYATNENAGAAIITVNRSGGSAGTLAVNYSTSDGTAHSGADYYGVTNILTWNPGDITPKTFVVPIIQNQLVDGNLTVNLRLYSPVLNGVTNLSTLGGVSNSVLTIIDSDAYGTVQFTRSIYNVMENGGPGVVTVQRTSGIAQSVTVNFATVGGTAVPNFDYTPTNGVLLFAPGELSKTFIVPIADNGFQNGNSFIGLSLTQASPTNSLGFPSTAILNIIDDETFNEPAGSPDTALDPSAGFNGDVFALGLQPNGMIVAGGDFTLANGIVRNRLARLNPDGSLDTTFSTPTTGADAVVRSLITQTDGRILIGGFFTNINGVICNHLARLNYNGALDTTFNIGAGADNIVYAVAETFVGSARKLFIGGAFLNLNGTLRSAIARVNDDASVDASFNPGVGANGAVFAVLPYPTNSVRAGQVLIGGDFTSFNGTARSHIARLKADGTVDLTFNPPSGANDSVRAIALQTDETILIGGLFTNVNGSVLSHIARLKADGTSDPGFTPGLGANDAVFAIALQPDNKILLGGQFSFCNGVTRHRLTRLNSDGTVDPAINFGLGADSFVAALAIQPDDKILIGGGFTHYDGAPHSHFARLYGRSINGSGAFEFDAANYFVNKNGTNAIVTVRRRGGTSGAPSGNVSVHFNTTDGTAIAGTNYVAVSTNLSFPPGEIIASVAIPIIDDFVVSPDRTVNLVLSNPQPPGGPSLGNQAGAVLTIINDNSAVSFSSPTYSINEDTSLGAAIIQINRFGSTNGSSSVDFLTTTNGTAVIGVNYTPVTNTVTFAPGQTNAFVQVPVIHDPAANGNRTVSMILSNVIGSILLDPSQATLTIIDVERAPGQFVFSATNFFVGEANTNAFVTVIRTNGHSGVVSVQFATADGNAVAGTDYFPTNGALVFADGETVKTFAIRVISNNIVQNPKNLFVNLSGPTGGATLGAATNVPVTIFSENVGLTFSSPVYSVGKAAGTVTISVLRLNGSNGVVSVNYATTNSPATNGAAIPGVDYTPTSGVLNFANGETFKTFLVPILSNNIVEGNTSFAVALANVQPPNAAQLVTRFATVTIIDNNVAFFFSNSVYSVSEGGTNAILTVIRTNGSPTGTNSVLYSTADGTATAGIKYTATSGSLIFTNGETSKTITIPILEETQVEGDETFTVSLATNAISGGQLLSPTNATVTIIDDDSGFKFSSPTYSVNEAGVAATITVLRIGVLTNTVSVDFATSDGTATAGVHYFPTNGTLIFTNGETAHAFNVQVIDETIIEGDLTVLLSLSNTRGQAGLVAPSAAVLTIIDNDGSLIVPAGVSLTAESGPVNGVIDPGERVTLLFGLRNSVGSATTNLVATLLATNGVTLPTGPQNYGVLVPRGSSASRAFSFTASGTNNAAIAATFQLQDGAMNLGFALFSFTLGTNNARFTNNTYITIRDDTSALPYPSSILVSNVNGVVSKATLTLTNLSHTSPSDIDMLLVSPGGQNMLPLAHNGGRNSITNVTLTLDDDAATPVPIGGTIVSGTNRPNPNLPVPVFPVPAPPAPYATNLMACIGSNPNGIWSLYVIDDTPLDSGSIAQGWVLALTTASVVPPAADLVVTLSGSANPVVVGSNLTYTIVVTNFGPASATDVLVTDSLPPTVTLVSAVASQGGPATPNGIGQVTCNFGTLAKDGVATLTIIVQPAALGSITNSVTVSADQADPYLADNTASLGTTVVSPSADLALSMAGAPDPVVVGNPLVYTLTISNEGPATATSVRLTNTLPASVVFVSATPAGFTTNGAVVTFTNLGNIGSGGQLTATITVNPALAGTITNSASVGSGVPDPFKGNNSAAVKTVVEAVKITVTRSGNTFTISWPVSATGFVLESASSLIPPVTWTVVTSPPTQVVGDQNTVTISTANGNRFFRLHNTGP